MKVILFDAMNLVHRARSGFGKGDDALTFSFFRSFKPIVEKMQGDLAYFVLEGKPKGRKVEFEGYKSNRPKLPSDFWRQQADILDIMSSLPVIQIRHPDHECDDVIANLAKYHASLGNEAIIISGDSDFIQIYDTVDSNLVKIYHPIKKKFIEKPDYNYLTWKALKGDASDNIPGIKGVGDKTATKLVSDESLLNEILSDLDKNKIFERNVRLIEFQWFKHYDLTMETAGAETIHPTPDMELVKKRFLEMGFQSMINEKYWEKFVKSFYSLSLGYN